MPRFDTIDARFDGMDARFDGMQWALLQSAVLLVAGLLGIIATPP